MKHFKNAASSLILGLLSVFIEAARLKTILFARFDLNSSFFDSHIS